MAHSEELSRFRNQVLDEYLTANDIESKVFTINQLAVIDEAKTFIAAELSNSLKMFDDAFMTDVSKAVKRNKFNSSYSKFVTLLVIFLVTYIVLR